MHQDYPQSAYGFQGVQQQGEQASTSERTKLTLQLDEVKRVKIELQQQREQQERQMEQMKAQMREQKKNKCARSHEEWRGNSVK